jgi:DNA/RNA-binding domain of Phe-tRNA-synthetase-like protein
MPSALCTWMNFSISSAYEARYPGVAFGYECPLPQHLKRTVDSGFPRNNLMVDAHFMAEMCAGILVAVTDYDRIEGELLLDVARAGETAAGMGGRQFTTKEGEIVLRDPKDITCGTGGRDVFSDVASRLQYCVLSR